MGLTFRCQSGYGRHCQCTRSQVRLSSSRPSLWLFHLWVGANLSSFQVDHRVGSLPFEGSTSPTSSRIHLLGDHVYISSKESLRVREQIDPVCSPLLSSIIPIGRQVSVDEPT